MTTRVTGASSVSVSSLTGTANQVVYINSSGNGAGSPLFLFTGTSLEIDTPISGTYLSVTTNQGAQTWVYAPSSSNANKTTGGLNLIFTDTGGSNSIGYGAQFTGKSTKGSFAVTSYIYGSRNLIALSASGSSGDIRAIGSYGESIQAFDSGINYGAYGKATNGAQGSYGVFSEGDFAVMKYGSTINTDFLKIAVATGGDATITAYGGDISFDNENLLTTGTLGAGAITGTSLKGSGLTSGRIPYITTGGLLTDSSGFLFNGTSMSIKGSSTSLFQALDNSSVPVFTIDTSNYLVDIEAQLYAVYGAGGIYSDGTSTYLGDVNITSSGVSLQIDGSSGYMYVNGNFGIYTTPSYPLDVVGTANISGATPNLQLTNPATANTIAIKFVNPSSALAHPFTWNMTMGRNGSYDGWLKFWRSNNPTTGAARNENIPDFALDEQGNSVFGSGIGIPDGSSFNYYNASALAHYSPYDSVYIGGGEITIWKKLLIQGYDAAINYSVIGTLTPGASPSVAIDVPVTLTTTSMTFSTNASSIIATGTGSNGLTLKNLKNSANTTVSGTAKTVQIDIGGTAYYFLVYPTSSA